MSVLGKCGSSAASKQHPHLIRKAPQECPFKIGTRMPCEWFLARSLYCRNSAHWDLCQEPTKHLQTQTQRRGIWMSARGKCGSSAASKQHPHLPRKALQECPFKIVTRMPCEWFLARSLYCRNSAHWDLCQEPTKHLQTQTQRRGIWMSVLGECGSSAASKQHPHLLRKAPQECPFKIGKRMPCEWFLARSLYCRNSAHWDLCQEPNQHLQTQTQRRGIWMSVLGECRSSAASKQHPHLIRKAPHCLRSRCKL